MEDPRLRTNREVWDEWVGINARSPLYRLSQFKAGENKLTPLERAEVGEVAGKSLLHLQCHFGMDTLSWAMLGAQVTGVDFSPEAVRLARSLAEELKLPARFIECNIYDLPQQLDEQFDVVFTSYGVLTWLPDLTAWAQIAARYVKPGGFFYIAEFHPFMWVFDQTQPDWKAAYTYFSGDPLVEPVQGSYADPQAETRSTHTFEWAHPLGEIVTSLIQAGLKVEFLHEHNFSVYQQFPWLREGTDGLFRQPEGREWMPLMFSLRARK